MSSIPKFFLENETNENEILNDGLEFAMEFGKNWLQPIQERLLKKYPNLESKNLDLCNEHSKSVLKLGNDFVYKFLDNLDRENQSITQNELKEKLNNTILEKYPWVNNKNINQLFFQSCYYAFKDGLDKGIK